MKNFIVFIILSFFSLKSSAQITEIDNTGDWTLRGKVMFGGIIKSRLQYIVRGSDTTYMFYIRDMREQSERSRAHYFTISFLQENQTLEKLYDILTSFFIKENKKNRGYNKMFRLGNTEVRVTHVRLLGAAGITISTNDGYATFTEKDINKLFNR